MITKNRLLRHLFYDVHIKTIQTCLPEYKISRVLCSLVSPVNIPTIKHTHLPPIIHHIIGTTLHMSTYHPIKTHHNSQPSSDKHIFVSPFLRGSNPNIPPSPQQCGGSQGGDNMITSRFNPVLTSSRDKYLPPLKIPPALLKITVHNRKNAFLYPPFGNPSRLKILTQGISVLYVTKNSRNSWRDSQKIIHFLVPLGIINSSTYR